MQLSNPCESLEISNRIVETAWSAARRVLELDTLVLEAVSAHYLVQLKISLP